MVQGSGTIEKPAAGGDASTTASGTAAAARDGGGWGVWCAVSIMRWAGELYRSGAEDVFGRLGDEVMIPMDFLVGGCQEGREWSLRSPGV